ncbi:MFS transporter [Clostridium sp. AF19-22AC]|jgi:CP family cyanate transporter-like MFS transporter|uniref:MFS transporter n=1 Tax=Clostridia TaxID=186801 RepID=UPI000E539C64|nr:MULTISPECIES: MFS transporter [Clostridia]RHR21343.1 MFS transporter [Clostridium sp. AF19-22AC]
MEKTRYRYVILILVCMCGLSACYCQYQMAPMAQKIMDIYGISRQQYATVFSAPMVPAILCSLPAGMIVDKIGAKRIVLICLILAAAGLWLRIFAKGYVMLYLCMLCPGFAATFVNATNAKIFREWFPVRQTGLAVGIFLAVSALGMTIGTGTTAMLPSLKIAFILAGILTSVTAVCWKVFMRERKDVLSMEDGVKGDTLSYLKTAVMNRDIILGSIGIMCTFGNYMVISTYLPTVLENKGMTSVSAGATASVVSIGYLAGCILVPVFADKVGRIRPVIFVLSLIGAALSASIYILPAGAVLTAGLFMTGICIGGLLPLFMSFPVRISAIGAKRAGTAGGIISTFQLLGAVIIPSYIVSPIAGGNDFMLFILGACFSAAVCVLVFFMTKAVEL